MNESTAAEAARAIELRRRCGKITDEQIDDLIAFVFADSYNDVASFLPSGAGRGPRSQSIDSVKRPALILHPEIK